MEDNPLLVFKANADPDTMYMHEALKEARQGAIHQGDAKGSVGSKVIWKLLDHFHIRGPKRCKSPASSVADENKMGYKVSKGDPHQEKISKISRKD